jgi:hypothetical protein
MKQTTEKLMKNLGHNNPPVNPNVGRENVGAEFSQYELDRYSKPEPRTQFDSKVEEDIYRAKKFLLKKNGHWD